MGIDRPIYDTRYVAAYRPPYDANETYKTLAEAACGTRPAVHLMKTVNLNCINQHRVIPCPTMLVLKAYCVSLK